MGNYTSREAQLQIELKMIFDKLMKENTIKKSNIMSLINKFKALKAENKGKYTTITNRVGSLNPQFKTLSFKGRVKPQEWIKLNEINEEFKKMIIE